MIKIKSYRLVRLDVDSNDEVKEWTIFYNTKNGFSSEKNLFDTEEEAFRYAYENKEWHDINFTIMPVWLISDIAEDIHTSKEDAKKKK